MHRLLMRRIEQSKIMEIDIAPVFQFAFFASTFMRKAKLCKQLDAGDVFSFNNGFDSVYIHCGKRIGTNGADGF